MNSKRWIFLRGLTRGNIHWSRFPEVFKSHCPDAQVEFLEIPGNGYAHNETTPMDAKQIVDLLRSKSEFVQKGESFNLCGISLGGMIALKWIELYPKEIESLNVINSSLSQFSPFYKRLIPNNYETLLKAIFSEDTFIQEEMVLKITSNKFEETKGNISKYAEFSNQYKMKKLNFLRQLVMAKNIQIESVPFVPFKVISSRKDRLVHYTCSREIFRNLGGVQYIHPSAGHDLPLDEPEWLSEILISDLT